MSLSDYEHLLAQLREELQASDTESDLEEAISHRAKGLRAPPEIGDAERHVHFAHGIEWSDPSTLLAANGCPGAKRAHIGTQSVATCFRTAALPVTEVEYRHMLKTHKRCRKLLEKATPAEIERDKIYTSAMFSESLGACLPPLAKRHAIEAYQLASNLGTADSDLKTNTSLPFLVDEQALAASLKKNQQISVELSQQIKDLEELARRKLAEIVALERANQKTSSGRLVTDATSQAQKIMFHIQDREVLLAAKRLRQSHVAKKALAKRLAEECQKEFQRKQVKPSVKNERESLRRAKKMVNEMVIYWKRNERIEKERRKKAERELLEKRKKEEEAREARRQARKFNFLITQTELYAHFMSKKLGNGQSSGSENEILQRLEGAGEDDEEGAETTEDLRNKALQQAQQAVAKTQMRTQQFDAKRKDANGEEASAQDDFDQQFSLANPNMEGLEEIEQPEMLRATLKGYQLKGLRWLSNLYQQGINGILADEMGLGKTIQSIATLGHLAEKENIWGPFLVVAPASTLHNWCNEISKFTPDLKVLPYWGTQGERKVLRGFWNRRRMHRKDADFHVMVTSYEMIVQDSKYLARVDWQYMVLDEAQAIKSSTSARWNTLLKFNCRNRLLLTGTPIQNTMAELWALLHFIMPTLFDSHAEFNEWFSKDIESHAQNSSSKLDQAQLQRLHMILKPFMLRRIKRNVEDELPDKVEIMIQCQLTPRQLRQYRRLKQTLKNKTLPSSSNSEAKAQGARSKSKKAIRSGDDHLASLLNIVMQFRKVCNHPDLLNLRAIRSPLVLALNQPRLGYAKGTQVGTVNASTFCYGLPRIVFDELLHPVLPQSDEEFAARAEEKPMLRSALIERKLRVSHRAELHEGYAESGSLANVLSATSFSLGEMDDLLFYQDRDVLLYELVCAHERERSQYRTIVLHDKSRITVPDMSINNIVRRPQCTWITEVGDDLRESAWLFRRWTMTYPNVLSLCPQMVCASSCFGQQLAANQLGWHNLSKMALFHAPSTEDSVVRFPTKALDALPLVPESGLMSFSNYASPSHFISHPDFALFLADCGKLQVLDRLLGDLKANGHRVLIYSQMTRMIDLLEEFMTHRSYTYLRLDGSSKISERRDMVSDFQSRDDIFAFILSTRAGGIGINLTAADTVIFYDSDWNPTVDQQAMDRAHRLGQTRTVTVYRLITKNSVEERILERAQEKSRVHQMVIQGGNYMPEQSDKLKSTEVMAMLLGDDDEDASQAADDDDEEEEMVNDDDEDEDVAATGIDVDAAE